MSNEASFRVRLDTQQAKRDLDEMVQAGENAAGRAGGSLRGSLSRGLRATGVTGAVQAVGGFGVGMARREINSGVSSWVDELTAGIRADLDLGMGLPDVRAMAAARQETRAAYAEIVGRRGMTPDVGAYFRQVKAVREIQEVGASRIDAALGGGRGEGRNLINEAFGKIVDTIDKGFTKMIEAVGKPTGR